jgi:hypothetical protein
MTMNQSQMTPQKPGFFSRLLRFLTGLILAVLLGALLGAASFYGVPALYRQFIQPVQQHTQQIQDLQAGQYKIEIQTGERIATLTTRLQAVELQSDVNKAAIAELETLQMMQATSEARLTALQTSAADHQSRLATLEASLQSIRNNTDSRLALLNSGLDSLDQRVATLESAQSNNVNVSEMHQQLQLLRSMQLLLRAQFYLSQDNYGLAAQDLQTASDVLGGLYSSLSADEADTAREVVGYLESALSDLPSRPVVANDKISTAWQILLFYLQKPAATPTPTPTAASTTEATTISIPAPVGTPTPTATAKP